MKEAADKACALQPELAEAWVAQGAYRYRVQRDFTGALQAYQEAGKRLPNSALVYEYMAYVERRLGRWTEAEPHYQKARELDPENLSLLVSEASEFLLFIRHYDEAQALLDRALQITPGDPDALFGKATLYQQQGRLGEAAAALARIPAENLEDLVFGGRLTQTVFERQFDAALRLVEQKLKSVPAGEALDSATLGGLVTMGFCQQWLGQHDEARRTFFRAVQAIKPTPETVVTPDANGLPSLLALAYAGLGEKGEALQQARQAVKDYETDAIQKPAAQATLAQIQALFGEHDAAIAVLPQLLQVPAGLTVATLKLDPMWDPLRKDPRFQKLIAEGEAAPAGDQAKP